VQGGTAVKPLVGAAGAGPGDAAVLVPLDTQPRTESVQPLKGVALSVGICPSYGELDPYAMAWAAVDEAMRNVVAVGADPDQAALLDNFCWGDPRLPDRLGGLVRCAQGCYDAALAYAAPFVSGKDSLNNEYHDVTGQRRAVPGTLLISALAIVPDVRRTVTMDLKAAGNLLYMVGDTRDELGGSYYMPGEGHLLPPQPVPDALARLRGVHQAIRQGLVQACHDCSEGGIGVALAEMCLAGQQGAEIQLGQAPGSVAIERADTVLFSESLCRFLVEVRTEDGPAFEALLAGVPHAAIGRVRDDGALHVYDRQGRRRVDAQVAALAAAHGTRDQGSGIGDQGSGFSTQEATRKTSNPQPPTRNPPFCTPHSAFRTRKVLILHAPGTNRDRDAALACQVAGADPEIVLVSQILAGERQMADYHMLVLPGGFSYGDDLGAGVLWALDLRVRLGDALAAFVASGRPVLGICNGFQALVKAGLLPGGTFAPASVRPVTLAPNESEQFECRWVTLQPDLHSPCLFTAGLDSPIYCPVAHGEGRVVAADTGTLDALVEAKLIPLTYMGEDGRPAGYPGNPSGSQRAIAGLCNREGNVLGLMPHPEDHIFSWQHPRGQRGTAGTTGLRLFQNGLKYA
jgi:phosphoribosylformylglycinamidine synthase I